jgi:ribosomal protein S18 acetylase RimI-like enzyme
MRIRRAKPIEAKAAAAWIAAMEPWSSLGYRPAPLGRYLGRTARTERAWVAVEAGAVLGIVVCQPDFLLGNFIALLAVRPAAAGQGIGRALLARVERLTFAKRRWLYVSSDADNRPAARFYRTLGFSRLARIPALIAEGRTEILWRKGRGQGASVDT